VREKKRTHPHVMGREIIKSAHPVPLPRDMGKEVKPFSLREIRNTTINEIGYRETQGKALRLKHEQFLCLERVVH